MARHYGQVYPERALMSTLSDLLGIRHFTTSNGGTVRKDFLLAVADALAIEVPTPASKEVLIRLIWTRARLTPMPDDRLSAGGTVTNQVLGEIIEGITKNRIETELPVGAVEDEPDLIVFQDERRKALREIAVREAQDVFRNVVLEAYGSRCAVTGTDVPATLEAAHILPYSGRHSSTVQNGLCLRRDIHSLFDRGMLAIDEEGFNVVLCPELGTSSTYRDLDGKKIHLPRDVAMRPNPKALRTHRLWASRGLDGRDV